MNIKDYFEQKKSQDNTHTKLDKKRISVILLIVFGVLVIATIVTLAVIFGKGWLAQRRAQGLLGTYEQEIAESESHTTYSSAEINEDAEAIEGYPVMGVLTIEAIDLTLPVIDRISDEALRVSACYYSGAKLGDAGNMVITGHNFASGAHFGNLDHLQIGDVVTLTAPDGVVINYAVYDIAIITPDDVEALQVFEGEKSLMLLTCVYNGNRRLLLRCKVVAEE